MKRVFQSLLLIALLLVAEVPPSPTTSAVTAADWSPGNIISDYYFYNGNAMTVGDIQSFLNSLVPVCDTWGAKMYGSITRAQWGINNGTPAPFICLKDYYENPTTHETNFNPTASIPAGGVSAAQIIYNAAQQYNINPKVLLVTIKKEAPLNLIADDWPVLSEYRTALGYACPDTAPCDSQYYGFYNQVQNAARQFRLYADYPDSYRRKAGQTYAVQFNPDSRCGTSNVYIETQATAGLYNYTPYQPNPATIAWKLTGGPAVSSAYPGCGAFGNINFWTIWNDWFGSTKNIPGACDTPIAGLACVWELRKLNGDYFYTTSQVERDVSINNGFSYNRIAFYVRQPTDQPLQGTLPTYRLQKSGNHFWTSNDQLRQQYLAAGWTSEGIAWYTDPSYSNTGNPVYKFHGSDNRSLYATSDEYNSYVSRGYTNEGEVLNTPTKFIETTPTSSGRLNVYRVLSCNSSSVLSTSIQELEAMLKAPCSKYEGLAFSAYSDSSNNAVAVNRFYNNGRYIWTTSQAEATNLTNTGWKSEGIAFYAYNNSSNNAVAVNRFYNNGRYIWTTSQAEVAGLSSAGWRYEGIAYYVYGENPSNAVQVNRLYQGGRYIWTTSQAEVATLINNGWKYEGIAYYAYGDNSNNTAAVNRFYNNGRYIWTTSQAEATNLTNTGWKSEGIAFYAYNNSSNNAVAVNRFYNNGRYIWTTSQAEVAGLSSAGWRYEGIAYYVYGENPSNAVQVNRLYQGGRYIWTTSQAEVATLINNGWKYEGIAYYAYGDNSNNTAAVNRFYNNGRYIWTTSQAEATNLTNTGWKSEGIAYYSGHY